MLRGIWQWIMQTVALILAIVMVVMVIVIYVDPLLAYVVQTRIAKSVNEYYEAIPVESLDRDKRR